MALAGMTILGLVGVCVAASLPEDSLVAARPQDVRSGNLTWTRLFAIAQVLAFVVYGLAMVAARRRVLPVGPVLAIAIAIQCAPLLGPLMLSTDAWSYVNVGRITVVHEGNPFVDPPNAFPSDPTLPYINPAWRDDTTVYGPGFVTTAVAVSSVVGDRHEVAVAAYKVLGALLMVAVTAMAARLSPRSAFAAVFLGWNPVFALQFGGAGHNDVVMVAWMVAALAMARPGTVAGAAGSGVATAIAVFTKWYGLITIPLQLVAQRARGRRTMAWGLLAGLAAMSVLAMVLFGLGWTGGFVPIADHAASGDVNSLSIWPRLARILPGPLAPVIALGSFGVAYLYLLRESWRGRARQGLALGLFLLASPFLFTWYLVTPAAIAAAEDDETAQWLAFALCGVTGLLYLGRVGSVFDVF
jgi:hypothetical protein